MTITQHHRAVQGAAVDPRPVHIVCCHPDDPGNIAVCGVDTSGEGWAPFDDAPCVVCADLDAADPGACPNGGRCDQ